MTSSAKNLVIAEWPDKVQIIKAISYQLHRLSKLYNISKWDEENSVFLAEWIFDNYKYDSIGDVLSCLKNPPEIFDEHDRKITSWRLSPDTIRQWMAVILEQTSMKREKENESMKAESKDPLPHIDYEAFKERIKKDGLDKKPASNKDNNEYERFRLEYLEGRKGGNTNG